MRSRRLLSLGALPLLASAAALPGQTLVRYSPGSRHYHLVSVLTRAQDAGGQHAEFKITNDQQWSVKLTAHARDTLEFAYTLDSASLTTDPARQDLPDVSQMKGTEVHGVMSATGKVYSYASSVDSSDASARNLVEGMSRFLIALPTNAKVGSTWKDTTRATIKQSGSDLESQTITTSTILGDTTVSGQRAYRIRRSSELSIKGTQAQIGNSMTIDGKGHGDATYYVSTAGVFLGSSSTQAMQLLLTPLDAGQPPIPVTQAVTAKIELIN